MTVGVYVPNSTAATGVALSYPYTFRILDQTHLAATLNGVLLALGTDYTVDGVGSVNGGNLIPVSPAAIVGTLVVYRNVPYTRATDFQDDFRPSTFNTDQDLQTMQSQQIAETIGRAIVGPIGVTFSGVLPSPAGHALNALRLNAAQNAIEYVDLAGTLGVVPASAWGASLVIAADAPSGSSVMLGAVISPAQIVANTDNYAPAGIGTASMLRIFTDAARNLTGITAPADRRLLCLHNVGAFAITLKDDATSAVANRFQLSGDYVIPADGSVLLQYDLTSTRWRVFGQQPTAAVTTLDGTRGLKIAPTDPAQGTWVNGTTTFAAVAAPTAFDLTTLTNNDGHIISDVAQFSAVGYTVTQLHTGGAPVFAYEYWNGAWTAIPGATAPVFTALGQTQLRFAIPGDWVVGGSGTGVPALSFNVRVRATTAPTVTRAKGRACLLNKVTVTADEAILSTAGGVKVRHTAVNLTVDIRVASAINGRDQAGAFGANSWAYLYIASDGVTASGLWSASSTAPTLQGAQTSKLLCGASRVDANSILVPADQAGGLCKVRVAFADATALNLTVATPQTITVPPEAVEVLGRMAQTSSTSNGFFIHDQPFTQTGSSGVTTEAQFMGWVTAATFYVVAFRILLSAAQTIYYAAVAASSVNIYTFGWRFPGNLN